MVDLPDIPNPLKKIYDLLPVLFGAFFIKIKAWFWLPLRRHLTGMYDLATSAMLTTNEIVKGLVWIDGQLRTFFNNFAGYVAAALLDGFIWWIGKVVELFWELFEEAWEEGWDAAIVTRQERRGKS